VTLSQHNPIYLILLGAPGAGKGTQAKALAEVLGVQHISSGDMFREALANQTSLGLQAKRYMERGELVPDDVTTAMVMERLSQSDCAAGAILDGFPRTIAQADALEKALAQRGSRIDLALYIKVSEEVLLERLAGRWTCQDCGAIFHTLHSPPKVEGVCDVCGGKLYQRSDDTPETQRRRIRVYLEQSAPLIEHYRSRGILVEIDGERSVAEVQAALLQATESLSLGG